MSSDERRESIIGAAKPLFAEKGFNGTSVRDIAKRADVSEALLYKHFPSKEAMYKEILTYTRRISDLTFSEIQGMEPSTETLVLLVYMLFQIVLCDVPGEEGRQKTHERLLFYSLLEDVDYAAQVFGNMQSQFSGILIENYQAAVNSGDLVEMTVNVTSRFWFVHHLAMALNLCHLSDHPAFSYETTREELADDAVRFSLRGMGLTDRAIATYFKPGKMSVFMKGLLSQAMV
jgi:AcrR family transcriptional regulator